MDAVDEWRVRETVKLLCERLGIDNISEARGDLDHLRRLVKAARQRAGRIPQSLPSYDYF